MGYRYYATAKKPVRYPFGYGLSYTTFAYSNIKLDKSTVSGRDTVKVTCTVKNTGSEAGKEVIQLYVTQENPVIYKPELELKDFTKVSLEPGKSKTVEFTLGNEAFRYYSAKRKKWAVESGNYRIKIGSSSQQIELSAPVTVEGDGSQEDYRAAAPDYYNLNQNTVFTEKSFKAVFGGELPVEPPLKPFTLNSTVTDISGTFIGKILAKVMDQNVTKFTQGDPAMETLARRMLADVPLRQMSMSGVSIDQVQSLVFMLNHQFIKMIKHNAKVKKAKK
ncbi:hypothetical protein FACS189493_8610 [Spirochaetia bacterium]|nr:hypothetical protein FACS189493_8610 [Spirochaetia bacterium]